MKVLETDRLVLGWVETTDAAFILSLLNQPSFIRNIGDRGVRSLADAERYIAERISASYRQHGFGMYKVELKDGGAPLGLCGLVKRDFLDHADIGFAFLPEHWSRGYAVESARAVLRLANETLGLEPVLAIVAPHNEASQAVLRRIGLEFERTITAPGPPPEELALFSQPAGRI